MNEAMSFCKKSNILNNSECKRGGYDFFRFNSWNKKIKKVMKEKFLYIFAFYLGKF